MQFFNFDEELLVRACDALFTRIGLPVEKDASWCEFWKGIGIPILVAFWITTLLFQSEHLSYLLGVTEMPKLQAL